MKNRWSLDDCPVAESKEKHGVWELNMTSLMSIAHFKIDYNTFTGQPYARVDLNSMPESTLTPSQGLWIWPQSRCMSWWEEVSEE
jgi:hypothetical protein